jgi:PhzF family phenazine biosynthesis protein
MDVDLYEVNAFSNRPLGGNPLGVVLLEEWLPSHTLQIVAGQTMKPITAFVVQRDKVYEIRCFTAWREIALNGCAVLAAAAVIMDFYDRHQRRIAFIHAKGEAEVWRQEGRLHLDLPQGRLRPRADSGPVLAALGVTQGEVWQGRDIVVVLESREQVAALRPDFIRLARLPAALVVVTAADRDDRYVLRAFSPATGVCEDAATATAHCALTPFWAARLGRNPLQAEQLSSRRAEFTCELLGNRVVIESQVLQVRHKLLTLTREMTQPSSL